jgi:hypothetical protein
MEEIIAEIESALPAAAGRIDFAGPPLPFPDELDASEFAEIVGSVPLTPLGDGVAQTIRHFQR